MKNSPAQQVACVPAVRLDAQPTVTNRSLRDPRAAEPRRQDLRASDEAIASFHARGFLAIEDLCGRQELFWLRRRYDDIVRSIIGCTPAQMAQVTSLRESHVIERFLPPEIAAELSGSDFFHRATEFVASLVGKERQHLRVGWRLFLKSAHFGPTFWHQDAAYRLPPYDTVTVWLTLDAVKPESGCLYYIPGSHRALLRTHDRHEGHLRAADVDETRAIACPVPAGGGVIHHCRTLHYASANTSSRPRRALALVCAGAASIEELW